MHYTYVLENQEDKSWYIGFSSNLKRRLHEHQSGYGGKTTSRKIAVQRGEALRWNLVYLEGYKNKEDVLGREKFLKSGSGRRFLKKQLKNYFGA